MAKKNKKTLVTHNGSFHADDVFACATLSLILEKEGTEYEIIRTRDEDIIDKGDYVFDVGGVSNGENKFDHHQVGGGGKRDNGIEYSSFGLIWKKFGEKLAGSKEVADLIDKKLVQPIDAGDNGIELVKLLTDVKPYFLHNVFGAHRPSWKKVNDEALLLGFLESVKIAKDILSKEIEQETDASEAKSIVRKFYETTDNKQIIILDKRYPWKEELINYPEPLFVIYPRPNEGNWGVDCVPKELFSFEIRKKFPLAWGGLSNSVFAETSGVEDAVFCHRGLFMAVAKSKEGAIRLAEKALAS